STQQVQEVITDQESGQAEESDQAQEQSQGEEQGRDEVHASDREEEGAQPSQPAMPSHCGTPARQVEYRNRIRPLLIKLLQARTQAEHAEGSLQLTSEFTYPHGNIDAAVEAQHVLMLCKDPEPSYSIASDAAIRKHVGVLDSLSQASLPHRCAIGHH